MKSIKLRHKFILTTPFIFCLIFILSLNLSAKPIFDENRAYEYLKKQCAFGPRPPSSEAHKKIRDYLALELKKYTNNVILQDFTYKNDGKNLKLTNIIATFGPETKKKILLCAHWDTRPFADRDPDPNKRNIPIIGANDGASGVAVLLELAKVFYKEKPPFKVIVVLFDGEDYGRNTKDMFLGSKYFAQNIKNEWIPEYGILLDMIGDKNLDIYIEQNSLENAPEVVKKVWELANKLGFKEFHNKVGYSIMDDHISLIQKGIPCIDIIDFNYQYWHTLSDTPDKCSPNSLGIIGRLLIELIYQYEKH
ncbi:MAG: M28 family peptidase [Candidatus Poribacteria bacterium]